MTAGGETEGDETLVEPDGMGASLAASVALLVALWLSALLHAGEL
jgi:hypothetical protein